MMLSTTRISTDGRRTIRYATMVPSTTQISAVLNARKMLFLMALKLLSLLNTKMKLSSVMLSRPYPPPMPFMKPVTISVSIGTKLMMKMASHIRISTRIFLRPRKNRGDMSSRSVCMVWNIFATRHRIRDESTPITPRITDLAAASPKPPVKEMMD